MYYHTLPPKPTPCASDSLDVHFSSRLLLLSIFTGVTLLLAHTAAASFSDVTVAAGLNTSGYTFGDPIWGDYDGDGNLDLFVDNHYNIGSYFYHNVGQGKFINILNT